MEPSGWGVPRRQREQRPWQPARRQVSLGLIGSIFPHSTYYDFSPPTQGFQHHSQMSFPAGQMEVYHSAKLRAQGLARGREVLDGRVGESSPGFWNAQAPSCFSGGGGIPPSAPILPHTGLGFCLQYSESQHPGSVCTRFRISTVSTCKG